jgi:hypothetical protein
MPSPESGLTVTGAEAAPVLAPISAPVLALVKSLLQKVSEPLPNMASEGGSSEKGKRCF